MAVPQLRPKTAVNPELLCEPDQLILI